VDITLVGSNDAELEMGTPVNASPDWFMGEARDSQECWSVPCEYQISPAAINTPPRRMAARSGTRVSTEGLVRVGTPRSAPGARATRSGNSSARAIEPMSIAPAKATYGVRKRFISGRDRECRQYFHEVSTGDAITVDCH
jgi:hypothetical protein